MAWLKFDTSTPEKPEVFSITVAMGWDDPDLTVGKLLKVWRWFDQHTDGGNAAGVTLSLLDRVIGVTGFAQAMVNVGWLTVTETGLALPNFDRHNGDTAKTRAQTAKRVAKSKSNAKGSAKVTQAPLPNALPREEKEKNSSVTDVTDADGVKTAEQLTKDELWRAGKSLLEHSGLPRGQCGSFVGKLVKDYGDAVVIDAVRAAVVARPADPAEYLKAACMRSRGERATPNRQEAIERRNQAAVDAWLSQDQGVVHA